MCGHSLRAATPIRFHPTSKPISDAVTIPSPLLNSSTPHFNAFIPMPSLLTPTRHPNTSPPPPPHSLPPIRMSHPPHIRPLNRMIRRPRRRLVNNILGRLSPRHPFPFKANIADSGLILFAIRKVIREEQAKALHGVEARSLDGQLLDFRGLRELKLLGGGSVLGCREVVDVGVGEQAEGARCGGGGGGAEEEGVEFYLGCETVYSVSIRNTREGIEMLGTF